MLARMWAVKLAVLLVLAAGPLPAITPRENPYLHRIGVDGTLRLELTERTGHPHFWWPRTLLNYRVSFDQAPGSAAQWRLSDAATGRTQPFQLSELRAGEGGRWTATLSFFSDLPAGGARRFEFRRAAAGASPDAHESKQVTLSLEPSALVLDTGAIRVRLPASQECRPGAEVPGPFMAVADARGWMGRSKIVSPRRTPLRLTTEILDRGPLFAQVRTTYTFGGGATYAVAVKAALGDDFFSVAERIDGLTKDDGASVEFAWTDVALTERRGGEGIDRPRPIFFRGEDPFFTGPARVENPAEEFYFRLAHTAADNTINVTSADFTDRQNSREIGVAVRDGSQWDDGEYAIWASHETLALRFRFADGTLHWRCPLATGCRDLIVAAYDPKKAGATEGTSFQRWRKTESPMAAANTGVGPAKSYISFLNSRQGGMSLDVIKDWQLAYADGARRPAGVELAYSGAKQMQSLESYLATLWADSELVKVEGNWLSPVSLRSMSGWVVPGFTQWRQQMRPEDRRRVEALLLFHSYFAAREEVSPMRHVLKGHPNFMTDWKYPLMAGAFLFPEHPLAGEWADQFEKLLELMGVFYVRPPVPAWEARGGRWTENIGVYNWAFLQPGILANQLGQLFDGRDRWPSAGLALHGEYLAGIVTAPVKLGREGAPLAVTPGTPLTPANGFQRIHPPQGAHSGRRHIPGVVEDFGESLRRYAPLVGEHLLWINQRPAGSATDFEGRNVPRASPEVNRGTNPRMRSAKYTGYGIVLRAAVDTPDEIAVFLQQIDKGPNYRWGFGHEGGGGDLYYYAGGKSYAGHLTEDAGDRRVTDAELTSNTGVYKDYTFRGIGMNDLTAPFYDLEQAQFAELLPRQGADAYAWPEYGSRSVLLVGHDYLITFDEVNTVSRLSWNTIKGEDEKPTLIPIRGETAYRTTQTTVGPRGVTSEAERFEPYKSGGDRMTLVSHRRDVKVLPAQRGQPADVAVVQTPESTDYIFQKRDTFAATANPVQFVGRVGVVRQQRSGTTELALFHGAKIGTDRLVLAVDNPDLGISAVTRQSGEAAGTFFSRRGGKLILSVPGDGVIPSARFFVDGAAVVVRREAGALVVALPPGQHRWQLTAGPVEPMPPQIVRSEARADGARLWIEPVAGAEKYRLERSDDTGLTWFIVGESASPEFTLAGLTAPLKIHVRAVAINQSVASRPGHDFPVYVTGRPPEAPRGLRLVLEKDQVQVSWGEILGATEYVLCRRRKGAAGWTEVFRGRTTAAADRAPGVVPAWAEPGLEPAATRPEPAVADIYEYAVRAVDGVGQGPLSSVADTNPASWRNWYPNTPLVFKRQSAYWRPPYVRPEQVPPPYYPR